MLDFEASFSVKKPAAKVAVKTPAKPAPKPAPKPAVKASVKTPAKPAPKPAPKPAVKASVKVAPKPTPKPAPAAKSPTAKASVAVKAAVRLATPKPAAPKPSAPKPAPSPQARALATKLVTKLQARGAKLRLGGGFAVTGKTPSAPAPKPKAKATPKPRPKPTPTGFQVKKKTTLADKVRGITTLPVGQRLHVAAEMVANRVKKAGRRFIPKPATPQDTAKALEAVKPIAHACKCDAKPVLAHARRTLQKKGLPLSAVDSLLAKINDVAARVEKAAAERLATYEHTHETTHAAFEKEVLEKLAALSAHLPACHPTRARANRLILARTA